MSEPQSRPGVCTLHSTLHFHSMCSDVLLIAALTHQNTFPHFGDELSHHSSSALHVVIFTGIMHVD